MVAGYSTTANVLTSCCFMLAQHQDEQEKLYDLIMNKFEQHVILNQNTLVTV